MMRSGDDPYHLERFVEAQDPIYDRVVAELASGRKNSHWMWFIFPQITGLGGSPTAMRYAISSLDEAKAYLAHPVLGTRLRECVNLVNRIEGRSIHEIFGSPDDKKYRSSMTLFDRAAEHGLFEQALMKYFGGAPDLLTLERL